MKNKVKVIAQDLFKNRYVKLIATVLFVVLFLWLGLFFYNLYKISKVDCLAINTQAYGHIKTEDYKRALAVLKSNEQACSKEVLKLKTNKDKVVSVQFETMFAESALKQGDRGTAQTHVKRAIDSLRSINVTAQSEKELKQYGAGVKISAEDLFMLDYEINKKADGSYNGYYSN